MKRPHDTQIGEQVLKRNLDQVETITADRGYDWDELRGKLREAGVRPVIKRREFSVAGRSARRETRRRDVAPQICRRVSDPLAETTLRRYAPSANLVRPVPELALKAAVKGIEAALSHYPARF